MGRGRERERLAGDEHVDARPLPVHVVDVVRRHVRQPDESVYSGGSTKYSSTACASATFTATGARAIAIVVTRALTRGSFKVYVDGVLRGTVSSYGSPTNYRRLIYQVSWPTAGTHRVRVVISGTLRHPRVDLDAFIVLR